MSKKLVIGYTTGVFDLFHIGHLNILEKAKTKCDYLIVGVTTDELALARKSRKPIIPFQERADIVRSIKYVDKVVAQDSMDKLLAWEKLKFDVMFVGDDWKGTAAWNEYESQLAKVGARVEYFPYTKTTSSTLITQLLYEELSKR